MNASVPKERSYSWITIAIAYYKSLIKHTEL
jgi:hypothetical protein